MSAKKTVALPAIDPIPAADDDEEMRTADLVHQEMRTKLWQARSLANIMHLATFSAIAPCETDLGILDEDIHNTFGLFSELMTSALDLSNEMAELGVPE